ncbi:MAG: hypothetical protein AMS22_10305 [Thiotrichales bacterium SG8_50]|nr:MAG: hypothetical protein AMS22_10305 [Thiotrichales bacterium SG8_50]
MERAKHYGLYILVGAAAFWIPDILIQWLRPPHRIWILMLTFLVPAIVGMVWLFLSQHPSHSRFRAGLPLFMLLGIWLLGPMAIAIEALPTGGKFLDSGHLGEFMMLWAMFPVSTFIMSTYSGSLGGVGLATLMLIVAAAYSAVRSKAPNSNVKADAP